MMPTPVRVPIELALTSTPEKDECDDWCVKPTPTSPNTLNFGVDAKTSCSDYDAGIPAFQYVPI
jgi:hypothetical protein